MIYYAPYGVTERMLGDGQPLIPGEHVELSADDLKDPHNARLIDEGKLLKVPPKPKQEDKK